MLKSMHSNVHWWGNPSQVQGPESKDRPTPSMILTPSKGLALTDPNHKLVPKKEPAASLSLPLSKSQAPSKGLTPSMSATPSTSLDPSRGLTPSKG